MLRVAATTTMLRLAVTTCCEVALSATRTVKLAVPAAVGVPVSAPVVDEIVIPAGKAPAEMVKVYGAVPPLATIDAVYAAPTVPPGNVVVPITRDDGTMVMLNATIC